MWQDRYYTDVTLVTMDDKQIKAHKLILSSSSNFFKNIFVTNPHPNTLIYLKDINHKELELVLKFMYHGKCNVDRSDIENFLATGSQLGISGLVKEENGLNEINELLEQSNTDKKYKDFEHPPNSTVRSDHTKKAGFEMGEVYDFTPAHIEGKKNEKKHNCDKCDFKATKKGNLIEHKRTEHGALTFKCDQCSYEASQDKYLTVHKEYRHQGIMNECDKCDFKAAWKNTLIQHKQVRHEGKWKKCENCDYKAATRSGLNMHIMAKHKGVRYFCDQCDHVATQERGLKVHKKRHEANEASQPLPSKNLQFN